jgi:hypothetical protein
LQEYAAEGDGGKAPAMDGNLVYLRGKVMKVLRAKFGTCLGQLVAAVADPAACRDNLTASPRGVEAYRRIGTAR